MKRLTILPPLAGIVVTLAFTGCGIVRLPPDHGAELGIDFKINGVYVDVAAAGTESVVSRRIAFSGSPVRIEGIPEDENALVSYMFMNGGVAYTNPVSVYLETPFADVTPRAMVRVIVTAENGAEDDCLIEMEAVEQDVLEIRVTD